MNLAKRSKQILGNTHSCQFGKIFDWIAEIAERQIRLDNLKNGDVEEWILIFRDFSVLYYCEGEIHIW